MKALQHEIARAKPYYNLLDLAIKAQSDPAGPAMLADAICEMDLVSTIRTHVMALLIGVPLDTELPEHIATRGDQARQTWRQQRRASLEMAVQHWGTYASQASPTWARAVLAVLLFGRWPKATTPTAGELRLRTRSPWALIREPANRSARAIREQAKEISSTYNVSPQQARNIARNNWLAANALVGDSLLETPESRSEEP